jgi:hypothetical protein
LLYGRVEGTTLRLAGSEDAEGQEAVGVYFLRNRGEIFLTESNVAAFEARSPTAALVIAGNRAGFFVRDSDGALQSIRSYEELTVPRLGSNRSRLPMVAGIVVAGVLPLVALACLHSFVNTGLSVRSDGSRLRISWKPGSRGELKISEGGVQTSISVSPGQSSTIYLRRGTADVKVVLTLAGRP